ncbi:bacillithiol biosynthesis cysteine-adding enzyme BshC [Candidatus Sumerlaeota bacterium]|nr:bacillithiol biosynthesis cysteine-adding enzyme BshC [Candidatus Sumerlaeota bacterium]
MESSQSSSPSRAASADRDAWKRILAARDAQPSEPWAEDEIASLRDFNLRAGASDATIENIARLSDARTLMVVAGQQAGIFLTPLYILYKAVAAVKWARRLADLLDRPVVPAFWIVSEDHDFDEIAQVRYLDKDGKIARWTYPGEGAEPAQIRGRSVFDVPMDKPALERFLDLLNDTTYPTEFKDDAIGRWRSHIRESEGFEDFFARGMTDLMGASGLVLVSPRLAPVRRRAVPILRREIENPGRSTELVLQAGRALAEDGRHPSLHRRGDEANFFLYRDGLRCKVTIDGDRFVVRAPGSEETVDRPDADALLEELERSPEHFSPNAILRPLVQDLAFPVLAMVAGPGERQYLPQLRDTYAFFGLTPAAALPRPRAIIVEPRIERHMTRLGVGLEAVAREDWTGIEEAFLHSADAGDGLAAIDALRESHADLLERARARLGELASNPSVAGALDKTGSAIRGALDRLESRVRDEIRREEETAGNHLNRVLDVLRPDQAPQERILSPLAPFLVNYGPAFVSWLFDTLDLDESSVQVLRLSAIRDALRTGGGES